MRAHGECGDGHMRMPVEPGNKKIGGKKVEIQGFIAVLCHLSRKEMGLMGGLAI